MLLFMAHLVHAQIDPAKIKQLDSGLTYLYDRGMFNGVVLIAQNGKIVYNRSLGNMAANSGQPLNITSSFNLASISKQFMTMLTMMLQEEGKLTYDDAVRTYLPEFPYANITIRHLMTHTSGLAEYTDLAERYRNTLDTIDRQDVLQLLTEYKPALKFNPGAKWEYNNSAYVLLGNIIEKASGEELNAYFRRKITGPLKMRHTYMHYLNMPFKEPDHPDMVMGMKRVNGKMIPNDLNRFDGTVGDGNIYSSAEDLLKWDQALYTSKLVKPSTLAEAYRPVRLNDGTTYPYGFGWSIQSEGAVVNHTGSWVGFRNLIERDLAKKTTIIFLSNGENGLARNILIDILNNKPFHLPTTQLVKNVQLIDGTGNTARKTDVRIIDDRIYETGALVPVKGEEVTDGNGMMLTPGFIDSHSHHFYDLSQHPDALPTASQGITTIVIGQDGSSYSMDMLDTFFRQTPVAVNVASYTGHATLREAVMGKDLYRTANEDEVGKMKAILQQEMQKGSIGLSTGLEYERAFFSNRDEVLQLAAVAAKHQGRYISHIRSEDINIDEAIEEIIDIGRQTKMPVQISHIKIAKRDRWNTAPELLQKLQRARAEGINITADVYPYTFWNSTLRVLFPNRDYTNPASAELAVQQLFDPAASYLVEYAPEESYRGKTISDIAKMRNEPTAVTLMNLISKASSFEKENPAFKGSIEAIAATSMSEADVTHFIQWPHAIFCSDGYRGGHPRGMGAFPRILSKYVREQKSLTWEMAIHKMTGLSAEHLGLADRGIVTPGAYADLVLLDPTTVKDNATISDPQAVSSGIVMVWVNGKVVYQQNRPTTARPGKLIKRN